MVGDNIRILQSNIIPEGFVHGFPERTGGISTGARASLNLGFRWGDDEATVEENRRRVAQSAGFAFDQLTVTKHVHGTNVWCVGDPVPEPPEFDGLVSTKPGPVLGAFAADCVPLVFAEPQARICAAAHAGWRGTVNGVAQRVVERMVAEGGSAAEIRVALGPSIASCCFEVGDEVVAEFVTRFGELDGLIVKGPRKSHIDLRVAMRASLESVGVRPAHIDDAPPCTKCHPDRFFSYRRDGRDGGVHMGFIGVV